MSTAVTTLEEWTAHALKEHCRTLTIHLYGHDDQEIACGGYAPQAWNSDKIWRFLFSGSSPLIYGYYLSDAWNRIYSRAFPHPWMAMHDGDDLVVTLAIDVTVKV